MAEHPWARFRRLQDERGNNHSISDKELREILVAGYIPNDPQDIVAIKLTYFEHDDRENPYNGSQTWTIESVSLDTTATEVAIQGQGCSNEEFRTLAHIIAMAGLTKGLTNLPVIEDF